MGQIIYWIVVTFLFVMFVSCMVLAVWDGLRLRLRDYLLDKLWNWAYRRGENG